MRYRVVWDIGYSLDRDTWDEAFELFCALDALEAFHEELRRPRIFPILEGEVKPDPIWPWAP